MNYGRLQVHVISLQEQVPLFDNLQEPGAAPTGGSFWGGGVIQREYLGSRFHDATARRLLLYRTGPPSAL